MEHRRKGGEAGAVSGEVLPASLGRMVATRASTGNSETNASTSNGSEIMPKPESSSSNGGRITTAIFSRPPQRAHASISMPTARFRRCAQRIDAWRASLGCSAPCAVSSMPLLPMPRPAGVFGARRPLFCEHPVIARQVSARGRHRAARRVMKSSSRTMCVVPSRQGVFSA